MSPNGALGAQSTCGGLWKGTHCRKSLSFRDTEKGCGDTSCPQEGAMRPAFSWQPPIFEKKGFLLLKLSKRIQNYSNCRVETSRIMEQSPGMTKWEFTAWQSPHFKLSDKMVHYSINDFGKIGYPFGGQKQSQILISKHKSK